MNEEYEDAISALFKYKSLAPPEEGVKADSLLSSLRQSLIKQN